MGRMDEALRRAEEERQRRRTRAPEPAPPADEKPAPRSAPEAPAAILPAPAIEIEAQPERKAKPKGDSKPRAAAEELARESAPRADKRGASRYERALEPRQGRGHTSTRVDARVLAFHHPRDRRSEEFRGVRTSLQSLQPPAKVILITSATEGEGKTVLVANLAASFAETGTGRVLVVDANLRDPQQPAVISGRDAEGLADRLAGRIDSLESCVQLTGISGVDLLPAGLARDNPGSLITAGAVRRALSPLIERYAIVLIDSPALDVVTDAQVLAQDVDGVVLAVRLEETPRAKALQALQLLDAVDARVLGSVVTHRRT